MIGDDIFTHRGFVFKQCWQLIPFLRPFYTDFENNYEVDDCQLWMKKNPSFPIIAVVLYLLFCPIGTYIMEKRKPFDLKHPLAFWNLLLSIFSFWCMVRTVPHLLWNISTKQFEDLVCDDPNSEWGAGATGYAVQMFILSKFPELIDTVFIVLRKKPLIFLHWYHHVTVLLYCWHSYVTESAIGLHFVAMNCSVHAIMYFYFFLAALKLIPRWFPSWIITAAQISQMVVGVIVVSGALYYHYIGKQQNPPISCHNEFSNLIAGVVMYGSYLLLFLKFAFERYVFKSFSTSGSKSASTNGKSNSAEAVKHE